MYWLGGIYLYQVLSATTMQIGPLRSIVRQLKMQVYAPFSRVRTFEVRVGIHLTCMAPAVVPLNFPGTYPTTIRTAALQVPGALGSYFCTRALCWPRVGSAKRGGLLMREDMLL
jgi:hypothetical protein